MRDIVVIQNPQIYAYELPEQEADLEKIMAAEATTATQNSVEEQKTSQLSDIQAVVKFCLIRK